MEMQDRKKANPWMWVGAISLILLFCCCGLIVALAIFGPMLGYYFGLPEGSSGFLLPSLSHDLIVL